MAARPPPCPVALPPTYASWLNLVEMFFSISEPHRSDDPLGLGQLVPLGALS